MILREAPRDHLFWLANRAKIDITPGLRAMEVVRESDGVILGMVGYDGWAPNSCAMHIAMDSPMAGRLLLKNAFRVAFEVFGRGILVATVLSSNAHTLAFDKHLGFREVFRGKDWIEPGVDQVWLEMRREDCRWLQQRKAA